MCVWELNQLLWSVTSYCRSCIYLIIHSDRGTCTVDNVLYIARLQYLVHFYYVYDITAQFIFALFIMKNFQEKTLFCSAIKMIDTYCS